MSQAFKLSLFIIFACICFAAGWWEGIWADDTVVNWIRHWGYWMILASTIAWGWSLWQAYPAWRRPGTYRRWLAPGHRWGLLLILGLWAIIQLNEEKSFKILLDEPVLINTSRMMHYNRETLVISSAAKVDGILAAKGYVDKRPNFFPFLVSVVHDLTGYRVENAYWLNAALLLILLALAYTVGRQLSGTPGGLLAVGMLGSVPLIWHQSSGAGFEILNLVMILLTIKIAIDYLAQPSNKYRLGALCLTAAMLAQVRYESVLFIIPVAILVLVGWSLHKRIQLPWAAWGAPLMLVPLLWQQRVFRLDPGFWELFTVGVKTPFSLDFYNENLAQAVYFFFVWLRQVPNAPLIGILGWLAVLAFVIVLCLRLVKHQVREEMLDNERPTFVLWVFMLGFALYFALLMCYAFDLGRYMVQRLALPLYVAMALAAAVVLCGWIRQRIWQRCLAGLLGLGLIGWTLPVANSREYSSIYFPMIEAQYIKQFIDERPHQRYLVVAEMSMTWTAYNIEAVPNRAFNNQLSELKYFLENPNNPPIYVVQSLEYDPAKRQWLDMAQEPLSPRAVLSPLVDYPVGTFRTLRISRLMDLQDVVPVDDAELYQGDEHRKLQDWVNQLP